MKRRGISMYWVVRRLRVMPSLHGGEARILRAKSPRGVLAEQDGEDTAPQGEASKALPPLVCSNPLCDLYWECPSCGVYRG